MQAFRPNWFFISMNSFGTLGELLASWDPSLFTLVPTLTVVGLLLTAGDMNITLESGETWGGVFVAGSSEEFSKILFQNKNLIEVEHC